MNDTQQGNVIINWKITVAVLFASQLIAGYFIGASLLASASIGLIIVGLWLALELHQWESNVGAIEP